jgi:hypothetical protein
VAWRHPSRFERAPDSCPVTSPWRKAAVLIRNARASNPLPTDAGRPAGRPSVWRMAGALEAHALRHRRFSKPRRPPGRFTIPIWSNPSPKPGRSSLSDLRVEGAPYAQGRHPGRTRRSILADRDSCRLHGGQPTPQRAPLAERQRQATRPGGHASVSRLAGDLAGHPALRCLRRPMVSAGYSGFEESPGSGLFVSCTEPQTHEYNRSLGRLLGRAAAVSAINERIERMGSSTKEPR